MKEIGSVPINLLHVDPMYQEFFPPLKDSEYHDLKEGITEAGIINNLIVEKDKTGYLILSGHHRKKIAIELGIKEVPCSLAETPEEKANALLDNSQRRQLTETQRKEYMNKKRFVLKDFYQRAVIPEIYELYLQNKIDKKAMQTFSTADHETQKSMLATVLTKLKGVPKAVLEKHEREIEDIQNLHKTEMDSLTAAHTETMENLNESLERERGKLNAISHAKQKAENDLKEKTEQIEKLQAEVDKIAQQLDDKKNRPNAEVSKALKAQNELLQKERETREHARKEKEDEIARMSDRINSLHTNIHGFKTQIAFWEHEVARISETYNKTIQYFSNPALIEVQLQVISEFIESLIRVSKSHKWDNETIKMVEKYNKSIGGQLKQLVHEVAINQKEILSLEAARQNVERALEEKKTPLKAVKKG